jgi:hypothetical protein
MKKRFHIAMLAASVTAAILIGVTTAHADQPTFVCLNIQPDVFPDLRNFITHSHKIAEFAEATGIYDCGL